MTAIFGPQNGNAATALPPGSKSQRYGAAQTWVQDCSAPGRNDGTILDAAFYNRIIGNLEYLVSQSGVTATPGDMSILYRAVLAAVADGAPAVLDTLLEFANALGDDPNFAATIATQLSRCIRVDKAQAFTSGEQDRARSNMGLKPIAITADYNDLINVPGPFGSAAFVNIGSGPLNAVQIRADGKLPAVDGSLLTGVNATGAVSWSGAQSLTYAQKLVAAKNIGIPPLFLNHITGLELSTAGASSSFGVAVGVATDSTNTDILSLTSAYTKTTGAWALGTGVGALDTGAIAANTRYYAYLIYRPDTGVDDVCVSLSATAPTFGVNIPAAYTEYRYIGSMITDGSSQWVKQIQRGDEVYYATPFTDANGVTAITNTASLLTLSVPKRAGISALYRALFINSTAGQGALFSSTDVTAHLASTLNSSLTAQTNGGAANGEFNTRTDTNGQIYVSSSSASGNTLWIATYGYTDRRGK